MVQDNPRGFPTLVGVPRPEREARLFTRANLDHRLRMFGNVLLHTLKRQTDRDFSLAVLTTTNLPSWALNQLSDMLDEALGTRAFVISAPPSAILRQACRAALRRGIDAAADRFVTFRIDDDDGLNVEYIAKLRNQLNKSMQTEVVTFVPGLECVVQVEPAFRRDPRPFSGAGLAAIHHRDDADGTERFLSVYQLGPHRKVSEHLPPVVIDDGLGFLRLIHGSNVSGVGMSRHGHLYLWEGYASMSKAFGFEDPKGLLASLVQT
ncbi:hypothetical protein HCU73_05285 [Roseibacterium sp. KMU-115]|uniref:Rhamnosyl transferase n=2 Tax=Roseicyclus persicicus TaxID=2650661 RepID=A0A7X6JY30_9RHOB|nr:hypothetical protein [Roseibacterium persicicum]